MPSTLRLAAVICLGAIASTAAAQSADLVGTTGVSFMPISSAGVLQGCSYTFQTITQDHSYKAGALSAVSGSVTFWTDNKAARIGLKVGVGNLDDAGKLVMSAPAEAFIKSQNGSTARSPKVQVASETPGFTMYTIALDKQSSGIVPDLMEGTPFQVGFNRRKGGMDVYATVDPEVADSVKTASGLQRKRSKAAHEGFLNCMGELLSPKQ